MSIEAYEKNLNVRLEELREGDPAYKLHERVIFDAIIFSNQLHGQDGVRTSVLDCGCGLGFITKNISKFYDAVGIDSSDSSINIAKREHSGVPFYVSNAEDFYKKMSELNIPLFDHVVLNMVLHSVDDIPALNILEGAYKCLKPSGTLIAIVPTQGWLVQKLIEYAQDQGMSQEVGIPWVSRQLSNRKVQLPVRITSGDYYPEPITVYNRSPETYENLLMSSGFGVDWESYDGESGKLMNTEHLPYIDMNDYFCSDVLFNRNRLLMVSFSTNKPS